MVRALVGVAAMLVYVETNRSAALSSRRFSDCGRSPAHSSDDFLRWLFLRQPPMEDTFATRSVGTSRERDKRRWSRPLRSMRLEGLGLLTADEERFVTMWGINQPPCRPILVSTLDLDPFTKHEGWNAVIN